MEQDGFDLQNNYFGLTPMSQRMETLEPGQSYRGSITITNPASSEDAFCYNVSTAPYGVVDTNYDVDLVTETSYTQMAKWITIDEPTGMVPVNGSKVINFTIDVPVDAPAGGQYAAILVGKDSSKSSEGGGVAIKDTYEMASLIYADINGETVHGGEILENNISGFVVSPSISVSTLLTNTGNMHEYAMITIDARNFFTGEVLVEKTETKKARDYYTEIVMPETKRFVERFVSENVPNLGVVHVTQTINYNGQYSKLEKDVIICPIWFLFVVLFTITAFISLIIHLIFKHRKRRAWR